MNDASSLVPNQSRSVVSVSASHGTDADDGATHYANAASFSASNQSRDFDSEKHRGVHNNIRSEMNVSIYVKVGHISL